MNINTLSSVRDDILRQYIIEKSLHIKNPDEVSLKKIVDQQTLDCIERYHLQKFIYDHFDQHKCSSCKEIFIVEEDGYMYFCFNQTALCDECLDLFKSDIYNCV